VRSLHATVLRRSTATEHDKVNDAVGLLEQATVLCMGRGRSYPALTTAIGERVGLVGALSVETAAHNLNTREIDGIVIADGFSPQVVDALLTVLAEDARFRDLPVGMFGSAAFDETRLPNLIRLGGSRRRRSSTSCRWSRCRRSKSLKRMLKSVDSDGALDTGNRPISGPAFWRDLERAVHQAEDGVAHCPSRASPSTASTARASIDAARLFSRLVHATSTSPGREQTVRSLAAFTRQPIRRRHCRWRSGRPACSSIRCCQRAGRHSRRRRARDDSAPPPSSA